MFAGRRPLPPEIFGQPASVGAKSPILNRYKLVYQRLSRNTYSEKSSITLIGSGLRAFQ